MKARKILTMVGALALTAALAIGGTLAYLTAQTDTVTNTFTVGNITMTLDETNAENPAGDRVIANTYKIIPGTKLAKDPTAHIAAGSEKCWVYVQVVDTMNTAVEGSATYNMANGWILVDADLNVWKYNTVVDATEAENAIDIKVFDEDEDGNTVTIVGTVVTEENIVALSGKTIVVNGYAHQSENVEVSVANAAAVAYFTPDTH